MRDLHRVRSRLERVELIEELGQTVGKVSMRTQLVGVQRETNVVQSFTLVRSVFKRALCLHGEETFLLTVGEEMRQTRFQPADPFAQFRRCFAGQGQLKQGVNSFVWEIQFHVENGLQSSELILWRDGIESVQEADDTLKALMDQIACCMDCVTCGVVIGRRRAKDTHGTTLTCDRWFVSGSESVAFRV